MAKETKKTKTIHVEKKEAHSEKPVAKHAKMGKKMLRLRVLIKRKHLPIFRGRFGVKSIRRKGNEKWQKWRKPRGEDVVRAQEDGARPNSGYRTNKEIRYLHPSGYKEVLLRNKMELAGLENCIVKIASGIGKKKRKEIIAEAKKKGLKIAN